MSSIKKAQKMEMVIKTLAEYVQDYNNQFMPGVEFMLILSSKGKPENAAYCSNMASIGEVLKVLATAIDNIESGSLMPIGSHGPVQ